MQLHTAYRSAHQTVGGYRLLLYRLRERPDMIILRRILQGSSEWMVESLNTEEGQWLKAVGIADNSFPLRRELLAAIEESLRTMDPPPSIPLPPLHRNPDGSYRSRHYRIIRLATPTYDRRPWRVLLPGISADTPNDHYSLFMAHAWIRTAPSLPSTVTAS
jgi:hypothetical protein